MKLLIATPLSSQQGGGPAQYAPNLAFALTGLGHEVALLTFQDVLHLPSGIRHVVFFYQALKQMRTVHVVLILDTMSVALPVVLAAFVMRRKSIIRCAGDFVWEQHIERTKQKIILSTFYTNRPPLSLKERTLILLQKYIILPLSTRIVFSTTWQEEIWRKPYGIQKEKTVIIENAYRPFSPNFTLRNITTDVVWIGRNITLKNVDTLDTALTHVQNKFPKINYQKYSDISHEKVLTILKESRMLVLPSLSEVSPNLALEAIALGVPVILTKECGLRGLLADVVLWIDPLSSTDIAERIMELLEEKKYEEMCKTVREFNNTRSYINIAEEFLACM